ncbi:MAG: alpha/beta hydrolase, partial [Actinomycetota bacterium]
MPLSPKSAAILEANKKANPVPMHEMSVATLRELMRRTAVPSTTDIFESFDVQAPTRAGSVAVRVYRPSEAVDLPVLMYLHGSGFVVGDLDMHDEYLRNLANAADIVIASVDYRLAPEHPYPAGLDDCVDVWNWLQRGPAEVPGDVSRLGVGGDSAGGALSFGLALRIRDEGGRVPKVVVTAYGTTEMRVSNPELGVDNLLTNEGCEWFWDHYTTDPAQRAEPYCSVAEATDLSGLGANLVMTAEYDPTRDATEAYARRLQAAGNTVTLIRYDGVLHGFFT